MTASSPLGRVIDAAERSGKLNLWADDIARQLPNVSAESLRQALWRQQRKGRIVRTSQGSKHWVIVPLRDFSIGAPPLESWLHAYLDKTLAIPYYVGLLSAAETYGASPYAVMVTQVVTLKPRRPLKVGRHQLVFLGRRDVAHMPTRWHETPDGRFKVSTSEVTALELVYRQQAVGGIARVLAILQAMVGTLSRKGLQLALERVNEVPSAQRLGTLLVMCGRFDLAIVVSDWLKDKRTRVIALSLAEAGADDITRLDAQFRVRIPHDLQLANA